MKKLLLRYALVLKYMAYAVAVVAGIIAAMVVFFGAAYGTYLLWLQAKYYTTTAPDLGYAALYVALVVLVAAAWFTVIWYAIEHTDDTSRPGPTGRMDAAGDYHPEPAPGTEPDERLDEYKG